MADTFFSRSWLHDNIAIPTVKKQFNLLGYNGFLTGIEATEEIRKAIHMKTDNTSMRFRYQPDKLFTHQSRSSIASEIKSESRGHDNFAVEFESYSQVLDWQVSHVVVYAFVHIEQVDIETIDPIYRAISCYCYSDDIPFPSLIRVPARPGHDEFITRITSKHPGVKAEIVKHRRGSGTPFFLISKMSEYLKPLPDLLCVSTN